MALIGRTAQHGTSADRNLAAAGPRRHGDRFVAEGVAGGNLNSEARARAIRRGKSAIESLVERTRPHLGIAQVSGLLGVPNEKVRSRVQQNQLLGFRSPSGDDILFPQWQFEDGQPVSGLADALVAFGASDPLEAVLFFAAESPRLQGRRPIDALREGDVDEVVRVAARHAEHGGR